MSCQQAQSSKNSDDPYVFTESPISTSVYCSQLGRQTSKLNSQYHSQNIITNTSNQQIPQRFNGNIHLVNGYHNPTSFVQNKIPSSNTLISTQVNSQKTNVFKQKTILQSQQLQNYLKPPPPLYHNLHNYLINHSTENAGQIKIITTQSIQPTSISSIKKSNLCGNGGVGGGGGVGTKTINTNELKTSIKTEQINLNENYSGYFLHNENSNTWLSNPTSKVIFNSNVKKNLNNRYGKKSTSLEISQYENKKPSSNSLNNLSAAEYTASFKEWHSPDTYIFDYAGPGATRSDALDTVGCSQSCWFSDYIEENGVLNRDQKLEFKKSHLRRQAIQYSNSQKLRSNKEAKHRLFNVTRAFKISKIKEDSPLSQKCCIENCPNDSLALTAYCYLHITHNADQLLFHPCTAKFSDNSQCRVPVFDIIHELPLCTEHAWKRDNYDRILQEQKPKKPPRKKPKPSAMTRPPKRNKKKKKILNNKHIINTQNSQIVPNYIHSNQTIITCDKNFTDYQQNLNTITIPNQQRIHNITANTQDFLNVCENSSAYESSEDTGVGGLSESELIHSDAIEENALGDTSLLEEHDLTNVLNQIPEETFKEFLSVEQSSPFEPTQEEKEDLERALEAVDEQVKSLQQITGSDFLGDFLDVDDQILDNDDIVTDVLQASNANSEIRSGLVHT